MKLKYDEPPSNFAFNFNLRRYHKVRSKILLQADLASKREQCAALQQQVRQLEHEMAEWQEDAKDAKSREASLVLERDLLKTQLASTSEELGSTQAGTDG